MTDDQLFSHSKNGFLCSLCPPGMHEGAQNMCGRSERHRAVNRSHAVCKMPQLPAHFWDRKWSHLNLRIIPTPTPKRASGVRFHPLPTLAFCKHKHSGRNNSYDSVPSERCLNWFSLSSDLAHNHVQFAPLHCLEIKGWGEKNSSSLCQSLRWCHCHQRANRSYSALLPEPRRAVCVQRSGLRCPARPSPGQGSARPARKHPPGGLFPARTTRRLPSCLLSIPEGECQPLAWTVMFPLWLPAWWMWRSLPIRRLRYAPAIFCFIVAVAEAAWRLVSLREQYFGS